MSSSRPALPELGAALPGSPSELAEQPAELQHGSTCSTAHQALRARWQDTQDQLGSALQALALEND